MKLALGAADRVPLERTVMGKFVQIALVRTLVWPERSTNADCRHNGSRQCLYLVKLEPALDH